MKESAQSGAGLDQTIKTPVAQPEPQASRQTQQNAH